jgi:hypothetical protein
MDVIVNLPSHLVTNCKKSSIFGFVIPKGSPKYVEGIVPLEQAEAFARISNLAASTFIGCITD